MAVYITNITGKQKPKMDIGVGGKTLTPGNGMEYPDEVASVYGVVAAEKKGLISIEMVKSAPVEAVVPVDDASGDTSGEQVDAGEKEEDGGSDHQDIETEGHVENTDLNDGPAPSAEEPVNKEKRSAGKSKKNKNR